MERANTENESNEVEEDINTVPVRHKNVVNKI